MSTHNENKNRINGMVFIPKEEWDTLNSKIDYLISIVHENNNKEDSNAWLGIKEVADLLHVSERTILRYRDKRLFPYYQIGKNVLFKKKEIEQFIETFGISAA